MEMLLVGEAIFWDRKLPRIALRFAARSANSQLLAPKLKKSLGNGPKIDYHKKVIADEIDSRASFLDVGFVI